MDIKTLCLGVLTFGPASGYDIKKYIETRISHFFAAGYGSIYPALAELAAAGMVTCEEIPQEGKPARKVYQLTERGRDRFASALAKTDPKHKVRSEFMVLMHFAHVLKPHQVQAIMDKRLKDIREETQAIERYVRAMQNSEEEADKAGMQFAAGLGKAMLAAADEYMRRNRHKLGQATLPHPPAGTRQNGTLGLARTQPARDPRSIGFSGTFSTWNA